MAELNMADVIANHRRGSHVVILQMPFDWQGKKVEAIEIGPFTLGQRKRWREGEFKTPFDLMCAVCVDPITHQLMDPLVLNELRNPDDERLEYTFMAMLPTEMRESVVKQTWPGSLVAPEAENMARMVARPRREPDPVVEDEEIDPNSYEDEPMREDRGLNIG